MAKNAGILIFAFLSLIPRYLMISVESASDVEFLPQRIELQTPRQFERSTSKGLSISDMTRESASVAHKENEFMGGNQVQMADSGQQNTNSRQPRRFVSTNTQNTAAQSSITTPVLTQSPVALGNPLFTAASLDYIANKVPQPQYTYAPYHPPHDLNTLTTAVRTNPVLTALLLSSLLGTRPPPIGFNSPQPAPDPFLALLLSHYGRYIPRPGRYNGLYAYNAANNIHNTRPFGAYKIYDDSS